MLLSILSLTNYDETIWDGFTLPEGLDADLAKQEILMQCAELTLVYPDRDIMAAAISNWSRINQPIWEKLYKTTVLDYNPIWNVDATITEENSGDNSQENSGDNSQENASGNVESVKGYNSNTWAEHTKDDATSNGSGDWSESRSGDWSESRSQRRTGNIGVTATQDLINKEREVAVFNIYSEIVNSFKKRFCLMVY